MLKPRSRAVSGKGPEKEVWKSPGQTKGHTEVC